MKKAVFALKKLVEHRKGLILAFRDKNQPWHKGNPDLPSEMAEGLAQFLSDEVKSLEKIIQSLEGKTDTKCRHPKKYLDKCDDVWYCMNCNEDLPLKD
ncbi:MAG: hypothetical protein EPO37_05605 [Nitrosarchaeum sp.]|nr:MAG: hypothetical protein EPO37_05605 [Nitrosarchaeum sp.]